MKSPFRLFLFLFLVSMISVGCGGGEDGATDPDDAGAVEVEGGGEPELAEDGP